MAKAGAKYMKDLAKDVFNPEFVKKYVREVTTLEGHLENVKREYHKIRQEEEYTLTTQEKITRNLARDADKAFKRFKDLWAIRKSSTKDAKEEEKFVKQITKEFESQLKAIEKANKLIEKSKAAWEKVKSTLKTIHSTIVHLPIAGATAAVGGFVSMIKNAYSWWKEFYERMKLSVIRTREALRDSVGNIPKLEKGLSRAAKQAYWFGFNMESVATTMAAMAETGGAAFQKSVGAKGEATPEKYELGMYFARGLGMGEEAAGKFLGRITQVFGTTTKEMRKFGLNLSKLAKEFGVSEFVAARQVTQNLPDLIRYGKEWANVAQRGAIYTTQFGIGLDKVLATAEKFKTFESAAKTVAELNAMFGTNLDTMDLMTKRAKDPVAAAETIRKSIRSLGLSWESMDIKMRDQIMATMDWDAETAAAIMTSKNAADAYDNLKKKQEALAKEEQNETKNRKDAIQSIKKVSKVLEEFFGEKGALNKMYMQISKKWKGTFKAFYDFIMQVREAITDVFKGKGMDSDKKMASVIRNFTKLSTDFIKKVGPKLLDLLEKVFTWMGDKGVKLLKAAEPHVKSIIGAIAKIAEGNIIGAWKEMTPLMKTVIGIWAGAAALKAVLNMRGLVTGAMALIASAGKLKSVLPTITGAIGGGGGAAMAPGGGGGAGAGGMLASSAGGMGFGGGVGVGIAGGALAAGAGWGGGMAAEKILGKESYAGGKGLAASIAPMMALGPFGVLPAGFMAARWLFKKNEFESIALQNEIQKINEETEKIKEKQMFHKAHEIAFKRYLEISDKSKKGWKLGKWEQEVLQKVKGAKSKSGGIDEKKLVEIFGGVQHVVTAEEEDKAMQKEIARLQRQKPLLTKMEKVNAEIAAETSRAMSSVDIKGIKMATLNKINKLVAKQTEMAGNFASMVEEFSKIQPEKVVQVQNMLSNLTPVVANLDVLQTMHDMVAAPNAQKEYGTLKKGDIIITIAPVQLDGEKVGSALATAWQKKMVPVI